MNSKQRRKNRQRDLGARLRLMAATLKLMGMPRRADELIREAERRALPQRAVYRRLIEYEQELPEKDLIFFDNARASEFWGERLFQSMTKSTLFKELYATRTNLDDDLVDATTYGYSDQSVQAPKPVDQALGPDTGRVRLQRPRDGQDVCTHQGIQEAMDRGKGAAQSAGVCAPIIASVNLGK
jgi:hypothetical protein